MFPEQANNNEWARYLDSTGERGPPLAGRALRLTRHRLAKNVVPVGPKRHSGLWETRAWIMLSS